MSSYEKRLLSGLAQAVAILPGFSACSEIDDLDRRVSAWESGFEFRKRRAPPFRS